jgi:hypothetical protein
MSQNNIQINNVSNLNLSKNKKNSYGVDYNKYIYVPFIIITVIIGVLYGLKFIISTDYVPN